MHDVLPVGVIQRRQHVVRHTQRLRQRIPFTTVQVLLEVFPLYELHDQVGHVAMPVRVIDADNIRVLQPGRGSGFGTKTRLVFGRSFRREVFHLDGLDRHAAVEVRIARLIHQPHGALAEHTDDVVTTKLVQTHGRRLWGGRS